MKLTARYYSRAVMKLFGCTCVFISLAVPCSSWPRYGRPHPLYRDRLQTNENILANAVLLGFDFNEIQTLHTAGGPGFGLSNLGLPNHGFPMNARERQRARQDVNTLTALGVIDGPEEAGPIGSLINQNRPDPPDNPAADAKPGKKKGKKKAKGKVAGKETGKGKSKAKAQKKTEPALKDQTVLQSTKNNVMSNGILSQHAKSDTKSAKKSASAGMTKNAAKQKAAKKKRNFRNKNPAPEGDAAENRQTGGDGRQGKRRNWNRGKHGRRRFRPGADPGEGHLAEQGGGDLLDRPFRGRGGRVVVWRTGGEEGAIGGGDFAVGR